MIVDYSTARPSMAALKGAGVTAVGRYIGWDSVPGFPSMGKNLTAAEAAVLHAAGIAVFVAFEYDAQAPARGEPQGAKDGTLAARQLDDLGAPAGMGVYFACDWDVPDYAPKLPDVKASARAKLGPIAEYFAVINGQHPDFRVGGYGGYYAVKRLFDAGLITLGWQTVAWSGGQRDTRAQLYQTTGRVPISGADLDVHEGTAADFGQWLPPPAPPGPAHPTLQQGFTGPAVKTMQTTLNKHGAHLTVDGIFGPATKAAVIAFQHAQHLTADGICGPLTWAKLLA
jgi:Rv2525c-like, glycoside hydrolase-like domain/Putative peptidoglycan binding domain